MESKNHLHVFPYHDKSFQDTLQTYAQYKKVPAGITLFKNNQPVYQLPFIISGSVKVYVSYGEKELLLYYLKPSESCIMTFASIISNKPSHINAVTEEETELLLLPSEKLEALLLEYPLLNKFFFGQYAARYHELLDNIKHLLFDRMDKRLLDYLMARFMANHQNPVKISHREIASDMATAREVISRTLKKLETEKKILITAEGIIPAL